MPTSNTFYLFFIIMKNLISKILDFLGRIIIISKYIVDAKKNNFEFHAPGSRIVLLV